MEELNPYKVFLRSKPGMYAQYDGFVPVLAANDDDAVDKAFSKLRRTSFPDRNRSMWTVDRVEREFN